MESTTSTQTGCYTGLSKTLLLKKETNQTKNSETWNLPIFLWWGRVWRGGGSRLQTWALQGFWKLMMGGSFDLSPGSSTLLWSHWQTLIQWWWLSGTELQNCCWERAIIPRYCFQDHFFLLFSPSGDWHLGNWLHICWASHQRTNLPL